MDSDGQMGFFGIDRDLEGWADVEVLEHELVGCFEVNAWLDVRCVAVGDGYSGSHDHAPWIKNPELDDSAQRRMTVGVEKTLGTRPNTPSRLPKGRDQVKVETQGERVVVGYVGKPWSESNLEPVRMPG